MKEREEGVKYFDNELRIVPHDRVVLDVRSPKEYAHGHIPGAQSLPLFTDDERAEVGTLYKQTSPEAAMMKGLEIVGPKMVDLVSAAMKFSPNKKVLLYCWRGGKRSESVAWLLRQTGFDAQVLSGGYKNYRKGQGKYYESRHPKFIVLKGMTGVGKTMVLKSLIEQGAQTIDLEAIACHKGSAFGSLGEQAQPSTEQFENNLFDAYAACDLDEPIFLEDESRMVGICHVPIEFYSLTKQYYAIEINLPRSERIKYLVDSYGSFSKEELTFSFQKITKKVGFEKLKKAIDAIEVGNLAEACDIALNYYDKAYEHWQLDVAYPKEEKMFFDKMDTSFMAKEILKRVNDQKLSYA